MKFPVEIFTLEPRIRPNPLTPNPRITTMPQTAAAQAISALQGGQVPPNFPMSPIAPTSQTSQSTPRPGTVSIYLDSNATTPVMPAAATAALRVMQEQFGNPSSTHSHGILAKAVMDETRALAAQVLGAAPQQVVFTSGATEGIQTAVLSALCAIRERRSQGQHCGHVLVYGATEHKAVPLALAHWNAVLGLGLELRALTVDAQGQHDLSLLAQWLPDTALLCTMAANNETGVASDLVGMEALLRLADTYPRSPVLWLVDCVQALGKLALNLQSSRIDYAPFSGHKLYAPKGTGLLYVRSGAPFTPLMVGGGQEAGMRGGTENTAGIAALGVVLQALLQGDTFASPAQMLSYRDALEFSLCQAFDGVVFNAPLQHCLPTTLNFSVPGVSSQTLLNLFDAAELRVSAGSACSAAKAAPSDVLQAMGLPQWRTTAAVRLSIGPLITQDTVEAACRAIERCGELLRTQAMAAAQHPSDYLSAQAAEQGGGAQWHPQPAVQPGVESALPDIPGLQWSELEAFLAGHPDACLVDVRDALEHAASQGIVLGDYRAQHASLPSLMAQAPDWLPQDAPVVLVCRSGKRSLQAAQCLRAQGHRQVLHVHGGLALRYR